ncbi:hypothetical protein [Clostridium sp. Marseille-P2415]|uniref:hypothetical protein n=1 Tax=Clostridium sp. Marseille-P2415 TaxID=1805471 RepID=UPI0009887D83|nr:hypothetical protein [Clostridium sp. Marseille-P2415]
MYIGKLAGQSSGLDVNAINRTAANKHEALYGKKDEKENKDVVTISPAGKNQSLIEQLMKQKDFLQERKQSLLDSAAENGSGDFDMQLKEYEKQLKDLDEQITQLQTEQAEDTEPEDNTGKIYEKPKTKEEAQMDQLNDIAAVSSGSDQAEVITSAKNQVDGRIRVLSAEINSGHGNTESKIEQVAELESRSQKLSSQIAEKLGETNDSISESNDSVVENAAASDEAANKATIRLEPESETLSDAIPEDKEEDTDTISQQEE